ncbi:transglutaminase-like domain-containing protein [Actinomadura rugatobispora]|uniref:Transglutaminase-like domain-containing protein n=1 Tax=Actinomadura rugatobispora TaxID=1994 RepID=A0ABW0ZW94_9ACTN|nr:transglutaminase family protein [Actinomadura rugatobispora]
MRTESGTPDSGAPGGAAGTGGRRAETGTRDEGGTRTDGGTREGGGTRNEDALQTDRVLVYRRPAEYVDSDHPSIRAAAEAIAGPATGPAEKARAFYYAVRDDIRYGFPPGERGPGAQTTADYFRDLSTYRASSVLAAGFGYCVGKSAVYTALCRASGLAARPAFADVRNHLSNRRLRKAMRTDVFAWHGYAEVLLHGRWVKVTPIFDSAMCRRAGVPPLEFDGESDAMLQQFDNSGQRFLSYVQTHGTFHDVPARFLATEMVRLYPDLVTHYP